MLSRASHRIEFSEGPPYNASIGNERRSFDATFVRYQYESFVTPRSVFDYDVAKTRESTPSQGSKPVLGGYDPTLYVSERLHAATADGAARVPIFGLSIEETLRLGRHCAPLLLYGYGSLRLLHRCYFQFRIA